MNNTPLTADPIYTVPEIARYLKMSKSKIYYLIQRNKFPHIRIQKNVRVRHSDLLKWLELQMEQTN